MHRTCTLYFTCYCSTVNTLKNLNRLDYLLSEKLNVYSHSIFAKDDGADAEESDGSEDVGGDARLQPRGSDHLQHGSSVSYKPW